MPLPPEAVLPVPPVHMAAVHPGHKVVGAPLLPVGQALKYQLLVDDSSDSSGSDSSKSEE